MKLKKYIPLLTIASTATIVTPLVTSCGTEPVKMEWEWGDDLPELTHFEGHYPLVQTGDEWEDARIAMEAFDRATSDYFENLGEDPSLFAKDVIYFLSQWPWNFVNAEATLDNVSVQVNEINKQDLTISYEVNLQGKTGRGAPDVKDMEISIKVSNVKFYVASASYLTVSDYFWEGTAISPLIFYLGDFSMTNPISVLLQEKVRKLLIDDSWFIDFQINNKTKGLTYSTHMNRSNASDIVKLILYRQYEEPLDELRYDWVFGSTMIKSSYLDINWEQE